MNSELPSGDPAAAMRRHYPQLDAEETGRLVDRWRVFEGWRRDLERLDEPGSADAGPVSRGAEEQAVVFALPSFGEFGTIVSVAQAYRERQISPVEFTMSVLARIERLDLVLQSYITVTPERALRDAEQAEVRLSDPSGASELTGIPYNLKDIIDTAGIRTTWNSAFGLHNLPQIDAGVASRLREDGAVLLGKSTTHEFAFGGPTEDAPFPVPRNPWDLARYAGGSSSGSAVSLAARLALASVGSDTGGSLRIPSAYCGVTSLKPTFGLISTGGVFPLAPSLDHVGPMANTARDCAIVFRVLAGLAPRAPREAASVQGVRVGVPWAWIEDEADVARDVRTVLRKALELFRLLGAIMIDLAAPRLSDYRACASLLAAYETYDVHEARLTEDCERYSDVFRRRVAPAVLLRPEGRESLIAAKATLAARLDELFDACDVILVPATATTAPLLVAVDPLREPLKPSSFSQPTNVSGHPSLTFCAGLSAEGLPIGLQLIGRKHTDEALCETAEAFEAAMVRTKVRPRAAPVDN